MRRRLTRLLCSLLVTAPFAVPAHAAVRLVEDVGATEQRGYVAVTLTFGCALRYVSHTPASQGESVQVRFNAGADCGPAGSDEASALLVGAAPYVRSLDAVRPFGSVVELRIGWARSEQFVLVPAFDGRGLRIRLLRAEQPSVTVREVPGAASTYAVNLASASEPFAEDALAAATKIVGVRAYQSETVVDEQRWYRLRAGPFVTEADAKQALANARTAYPKAWVAIADDAPSTAPGTPDAVTNVPVQVTRPSTTLVVADIDRLLRDARDAFRRKDYAAAIPLLTRLTEQPEFPRRAEAQELLGLSRERSGQLAHAKAEYEDYLRRYPQGDGAERVRKRQRALALAMRPGRGAAGRDADESPWKLYGGFSQLYRQDQSKIETGIVSNDVTTQDAVLSDVAFVARRRGERFDFSSRTSAGYTYDMLEDGAGSQQRVSILFAEISDRELGWTARIGRQSGNSGALLGTFDGLHASYQLFPHLRINGYAGYPSESTRTGPATDRRFVAVSADLGTFADSWDCSIYAASQDYFGATDRQAIGTEVRMYRPGLTLVGRIDYDLYYQSLNDVLMLATFALPGQWTASVNLDRRASPSLTTRNAMIGQPVQEFDELFGLYSPEEIEQLAEDRTAEAQAYSVALSRPLGERWQWSVDVSSMTLGATPESGGVGATPATGSETSIATQALGYGLFGRGDTTSFGLQFQAGDTAQTISLGLGTQLPVGERWRLGPRLRVDQRDFDVDGSRQLVYSPSMRAELRGAHLTLEFEGGAEFGTRDFGTGSTDTTRHYASLGYRYDF
jgi:hypothetical protein